MRRARRFSGMLPAAGRLRRVAEADEHVGRREDERRRLRERAAARAQPAPQGSLHKGEGGYGLAEEGGRRMGEGAWEHAYGGGCAANGRRSALSKHKPTPSSVSARRAPARRRPACTSLGRTASRRRPLRLWAWACPPAP
eukprot:6196414-Pleurochrysis_carterae.AAC.2